MQELRSKTIFYPVGNLKSNLWRIVRRHREIISVELNLSNYCNDESWKWHSIPTVFANESVILLCTDLMKTSKRADCHHQGKFSCLKTKCSIFYSLVYQRKRSLQQTLAALVLKQIEREYSCVSTLCCLLCPLKTPDEILNFYSSLFVKIILFSIKTISVLQNPSAFTEPKCNYINPSW